MLIRLLCAHEMTKHVCKISRLNSKRLLRKLQKNVRGLLYFAAPCISSCSVLLPEIIMHNAFYVILWTSIANICIVHDDLGWNRRTELKNRTTRYILPRHWLYEWFSQLTGRKPAIISSCLVLPPEIIMHDPFNVIHWTLICQYMRCAWRSRAEEPNNSIYSAASLALRVIFSVS